uniref:Uridylate-specific endoribonuclease n=1 Tax=Sphaeramia orbicularis TaxID=375764 RepID=A0A672YGA5_9TELE
AVDVNRMKPGLTTQSLAGFVNQGSQVVQDHASLPLFSNVNEVKLRNTTTISRFMKLLDNYERSTGVTERVTTEETGFIHSLSVISPQRAHQYLGFKSQLILICLDSCGFEHVFVGETRSGTEIIGFHNWIQFYLQEKNRQLDYKGYKAREHDLPDHDDHVLNLQFTWHGVVKPVGSAFIGTSPEFEMAIFTVVFLMNTERSTTVLVNIAQCQMELVVIRHGRSLGTAYPRLLSSNSRHMRQRSH